ncbi:MAG: translocation/assembly module TamB domain-containing protein [Candidatus Erginobacter occultus]|nr:translocation/assembly module TamB domain-containing protein [Candidatus Erginobacter occultus]
MKEQKTRSLPVRIIRRVIKYAVRLVLAVIILSAVILATIQTPPGKRLLARALTRIASTPETTIRFGRISGILPFRVRLSELRLGDPEGDWMVIEDSRVRLDPFELLSLRLHATSVTVERVTWYRIPEAGEEDDSGDEEQSSFTPAEIPSLTVDRLTVKKATAAESLVGRRVEVSLEGEVSNSVSLGPRAQLRLAPLWREGEVMTVSANSAADLSRLEVELKLDEAGGGELGGFFFPGDPGPLAFRFRAEGPWEGVKTELSLGLPDRLEVKGDLTLDLSRILLEGELTASVGRPPFPGWAGRGDLSARFTVEDGGQNLSARIEGRDLACPIIGLERFRVEAELADLFRAVRGEVNLQAAAASLPTPEDDPDPGDLFGEVTGRLVLHNGGRAPGADLELQIRGYTIPGLLLQPGEIRVLDLTGRLGADRLELTVQGTGERGFRLESRLSAASRLPAGLFSVEFPEDGDLKGSLSAGIDLSFLNNYLALTRQTLGGRAEIEFGLGGTWSRPVPRGRIAISGGEYQNLNTGTVLHDLTGRLEVEEDRLVLEELTARTPRPSRPLFFSWTRFIPGIRFTPLADQDREITKSGRISLTGSTRLSPAEGYPSSYTLLLEDALLADMELVTAIVAGKIEFQGSLKESRLAGKLRLRRLEGRIPTRVASSVPEIEVTEINKPGEEAPRPPTRPEPFLEKMALDLKLTAPNNVVVQGRGLDSEWKADISVSGTAAAPEIRGGLTLLSGIFIFMGEEMTLGDCTVMMDGEYPPVPQLKINARIVKPDIVMDLQVVGPVTKPEVLISSQPPYPNDEILARLLFGRPASQLSGLQALQIANGLRTLQGQAGFFDLLTSWTSFLGNIQVDFTDLEGTEDQTAVRVRWSLSRNFYIENQRSIESPNNLFLARWEIIRNFQLRVQSGYGILGDSAFLHWQMDY